MMRKYLIPITVALFVGLSSIVYAESSSTSLQLLPKATATQPAKSMLRTQYSQAKQSQQTIILPEEQQPPKQQPPKQQPPKQQPPKQQPPKQQPPQQQQQMPPKQQPPQQQQQQMPPKQQPPQQQQQQMPPKQQPPQQQQQQMPPKQQPHQQQQQQQMPPKQQPPQQQQHQQMPPKQQPPQQQQQQQMPPKQQPPQQQQQQMPPKQYPPPQYPPKQQPKQQYKYQYPLPQYTQQQQPPPRHEYERNHDWDRPDYDRLSWHKHHHHPKRYTSPFRWYDPWDFWFGYFRYSDFYFYGLIYDDDWNWRFPGCYSYRWYDYERDNHGFYYRGKRITQLILVFDPYDGLVGIGFMYKGLFIFIRDDMEEYYFDDEPTLFIIARILHW